MKINIEELNKNKEKAIIYQKEEKLNFSNIKIVFENINCHYQTKNTTKLTELEKELTKKLDIIKNNHQNNITIIEKNINKYKEMNRKTEKILNITEGK